MIGHNSIISSKVPRPQPIHVHRKLILQGLPPAPAKCRWMPSVPAAEFICAQSRQQNSCTRSEFGPGHNLKGTVRCAWRTFFQNCKFPFSARCMPNRHPQRQIHVGASGPQQTRNSLGRGSNCFWADINQN